MRLGVLSDTHGHAANTKHAVEKFKQLDVEQILHCGDVGSEEVVSQFSQWPTYFVAGNCDYPDELGEIVKRNHQHWEGLFGDLCIEDRQIALLHSHEQHRFDAAVASGQYDLVCYGHTHKYEHHTVGKTHVLNPGAMYRAPQFTIAVVELTTMEISHIEVQTDS